jgi:hypothetical protein
MREGCGEERIGCGPTEKFKQLGAQAVAGVVIGVPTFSCENMSHCLWIIAETA